MFFDDLRKSLENVDTTVEVKLNKLLQLLEFFKDKESSLLFRFLHKNDGQYVFYIESRQIPDERYLYYHELFERAGMVEEIIPGVDQIYNHRHEWKVESCDFEEIDSKMDFIVDFIKNNYSLSPPMSDDEIIGFSQHARYMMRTLSEEEFNRWLDEKRVGLEFEHRSGKKR